jgi:hypothetical protein
MYRVCLFVLWCLTPLSTIFQLYRSCHFFLLGEETGSTRRKPTDYSISIHITYVVILVLSDAISAYHYWCCEFESRSGWGVQHYVIKFVSDLRQVHGFLRVLRFPPQRWPLSTGLTVQFSCVTEISFVFYYKVNLL